MRKKVFDDIIVIISLFVLIELLINKKLIYLAIINALTMWVYNLIPALFPFFIISDILINYNITIYIPRIFKIFCKRLFKISDNMLTIFLLSVIAGFPSNARNTRTLYDKGLITVDEANHILIFSHFANPVFILTTVSVYFFHNQMAGIILLVTHYLSNIILGVLFRDISYYNENNIVSNKHPDFGIVFISAIKKAIDTTLTICGVVVVFLILATIVINTFNVNLYNQMLIKGIFEITIGIEALSKLTIGLNYKMVIASMFLAFGGISVHIQVLSQIAGTKIKYYCFFIGRVYQMIIAGILTYIATIILGI